MWDIIRGPGKNLCERCPAVPSPGRVGETGVASRSGVPPNSAGLQRYELTDLEPHGLIRQCFRTLSISGVLSRAIRPGYQTTFPATLSSCNQTAL